MFNYILDIFFNFVEILLNLFIFIICKNDSITKYKYEIKSRNFNCN